MSVMHARNVREMERSKGWEGMTECDCDGDDDGEDGEDDDGDEGASRDDNSDDDDDDDDDGIPLSCIPPSIPPSILPPCIDPNPIAPTSIAPSSIVVPPIYSISMPLSISAMIARIETVTCAAKRTRDVTSTVLSHSGRPSAGDDEGWRGAL